MVIDRPLWTRIFADDAVICGGEPGEVEVCPGEERKEGKRPQTAGQRRRLELPGRRT